MSGKESNDFVSLSNSQLNFEKEILLVHEKILPLFTDTIKDNSIPTDHPQNIPLIYLEFGVYEGRTIRIASKINLNPKSHFIGFDSFEGLPEDWQPSHKKGDLSTNGNIPKILDSRITFVKGLFHETLDAQINEILNLVNTNPHHQLLINMDADLFSSTLYILSKLDKVIKKDVLIRFDEFGYLDDNSEFLAFQSFVKAYHKNFEVIMSDKWYRHVIIRIL